MQINWISELSQLKHLVELDVEGNLVEDLEEVRAFSICSNLKVLNLAGNPVTK